MLYESNIKSKRFKDNERRITCTCGSRRVEVIEMQNDRPDVIDNDAQKRIKVRARVRVVCVI